MRQRKQTASPRIQLGHLLLATLVVAILASVASATPPGQYRVILKPEMISTSPAIADFSPLVDEQLDLGDPPTGEPVTAWKAEWRYADQYPVHAVIDLGKERPLATFWIYDTNGSGDIKLEAGNPDAWQEVATYDCSAYKQWKSIPLDRPARYLRLTVIKPAPGFNEIAVDAYSPKAYTALLARQAEQRRLEAEQQAALKHAREEALKRPLIQLLNISASRGA